MKRMRVHGDAKMDFYDGVLSFHMVQYPQRLRSMSAEERTNNSWKAVGRSFVTTGQNIDKAIYELKK